MLAGQPILILKEGTRRERGREAMENNIAAAVAIADAVKTTLGPKGMDKMLVDSMGDVVITNDGVTILKEIDVEHPAAKMMVEVAKTQDEAVGDGTTTAVVLAGELLKNARSLLDQKIHPVTIIEGYKMAADKALEFLNEIATPISRDNMEMLKRIAMTAMTGKQSAPYREYLAELAVKAVLSIVEEVNGKIVADIDNVKVEKKVGGSVKDTEFIDGIVIDKERVHPGMPKVVRNAKIALINAPLEVKKTEFDAEIQITDPEQIKKFLESEEMLIKDMVEKIKAVGANVVFCQKGIDDLAQHYLAKAGIYAVRRVKKSDMEKLAKATGARIVTKLEDLSPEDLGEAEVVEERKIGEDNMTFVIGAKNKKAVSILIRGGTEHVVDEIERSMHDALSVVAAAIEDQKITPGGGATAVELAMKLRDYAARVGGREQMAIEAFADALESIPKILALNGGLDPIDVLIRLRTLHKEDKRTYGVSFKSEEGVGDMFEEGVVEPLRVPRQEIVSAVEAATMILRIDDVIAAKPLEKGKEGKEGGVPETETETESSEF